MIDWSFVAVHFVWILGLAIVLATISYHDWKRREGASSWPRWSQQRAVRVPLAIGLACLIVGVTLALSR